MVLGHLCPLNGAFGGSALAEKVKQCAKLMLQLLFAPGGFLTSLLVPFSFGLGLAAGQTDATGQNEDLDLDRISPALNCTLCLVQEFSQFLVVPCLEKCFGPLPRGLIVCRETGC